MTEATTIVSVLAIVISIVNVALNVRLWRQEHVNDGSHVHYPEEQP